MKIIYPHATQDAAPENLMRTFDLPDKRKATTAKPFNKHPESTPILTGILTTRSVPKTHA